MAAYPIEKKLVIAVASSALFDLHESDRIFREEGLSAYRSHQEEHKDDVLNPGVAFPFVRRLLNLNKAYPEDLPVEVLLLSRNDPDTGMRVFNSIEAHNLDITRAAFTRGKAAHDYISAFNVSLFLSANEEDVRAAVSAGFPAGLVLDSKVQDDAADDELRIAFDFDGILADDESEQVFKEDGIEAFKVYEVDHAQVPHAPGILYDLFQKLSFFQQLELNTAEKDPEFKRQLRIAIITARSAPVHERVVTTLKSWGVMPDETFFLGGIDKGRVLNVFKPHIFFDDQMVHLKEASAYTPSVHVPFGKLNKV